MADKGRPDRTDIAILEILQAEARISNHTLAQRIHLSPSSCLARVRKLERAGIVRSYNAGLELERICRSVTVVAQVTLNNHDETDFQRFEEAVRAIPQVIECLKVSGEYDYMLRFVCADMAQYDTLSDRLLRAGRGVAHLSSHVVLDRTKSADGFPLRSLLQSDTDPNGN